VLGFRVPLDGDAEMITGFDLRVDAGAIAKYWPWIPSST
jgi:hypothetical protein